jgi:hypothetical protein
MVGAVGRAEWQQERRAGGDVRERAIGWVIPKQGRWRLVMLKERKPEDADDFCY